MAERAADRPSLLIVDDEEIVRESLGGWFQDEGYEVGSCASAREGLIRIQERAWDVCLVDIKMPGMDGLELQRRFVEIAPDMPVIVMTAYASVETAVSALKSGAFDYIVKPFDPEDLARLVAKALEVRRLKHENRVLRERIEDEAPIERIVGDGPEMARVKELIRTVGPTDSTVLIEGESGTGKELVARAIHGLSPRRYMPLVIVNCGALPEALLEAELFGHEKGAFTGAHQRRKGKIEIADGGTLFLDEVGEIPAKMQVDLLRVLEDRSFTRVGGNKTLQSDFRVVAATNRPLEEMVEAGIFRRDLYYRLNVVRLALPPLRARRSDIPQLAEALRERLAHSMNKKFTGFAPEAMETLVGHSWPGNVRELENAIERAMVVGTPPLIRARDLPLGAAPRAEGPAGGPKSLADMERIHLQRVLEETGWNISRAARELDIDRTTLYAKIRRYGLERQGMIEE
ncbi:MAG: sigma-54 dependent transcriptional regulator [Acidobacteria bacterium]|jgi:DNA-binding NtrC family response regulator|nr:sigma-54 dependent transcriptional regulator [Acidobacteriota bacterium]